MHFKITVTLWSALDRFPSRLGSFSMAVPVSRSHIIYFILKTEDPGHLLIVGPAPNSLYPLQHRDNRIVQFSPCFNIRCLQTRLNCSKRIAKCSWAFPNMTSILAGWEKAENPPWSWAVRDFMLSCHDFTRASSGCLTLAPLKAFSFLCSSPHRRIGLTVPASCTVHALSH